MRKTLYLSSALALLIATSAAYAGNVGIVNQTSSSNSGVINQTGDLNTSKFTQKTGSGNTADVTQTGLRNQAGTHLQDAGVDTSGDTHSGYNYMTQSGSSNVLSITQTDNGSTVAASGGHVTQTGNYNSATINQQGGSNNIYYGVGGAVGTVEQTDLTGTATALTNELTITQSGAADGTYGDVPAGSSDYHYALETVGKVVQTNTGGAANSLELTQSGGIHNAPNVITLATQSGTGNTGTVSQTGRSNLLSSLFQSGTTNDAHLTQTGIGNEVALLSQTGTSNYANLSFIGSYNGTGGISTLTGVAGAVGLDQGKSIQNGVSNSITYLVTGDSNLFAFNQNGDNNSYTGTVNGNSNQVAIQQIGSGNFAGTVQNGNNNNAAINQHP